MPQEFEPFNPQPHKPDESHPPKGQNMTKTEATEKLRSMIERDKKAKLEAQKEAAKIIKDAMTSGQVPGKNRGEPTGPIKERVVEPGRTPRSGSDERHKKKEKLRLQFVPDPDESAYLNSDIFSRTGSSLTNHQLQEKLGATEIVKLLYLLNPGKKKDKINKEEAARVVRENAFVIGPSLLQTQSATASGVLREISFKNLLAKKFVNGDEGVERLCELIEQEVKFPGWPSVSKNWKAISALGAGREVILTPEYVMDKLGAILISSDAKIKNDIAEYKKKNEDAKAVSKKKKEIEKAQREILRRSTQK